MRLEPVGLPALPYEIKCLSESPAVKFIMGAEIMHDLKIQSIRINNQQIRFEMITGNKYSSLRRKITVDHIMDLEEKIDYVNNYLCHTAFQLNALRGNGYTGYVVIEELEGHSYDSRTIRDDGVQYLTFSHEKNGMVYQLMKTADYDHWFMGSRDNLIDTEIKSIPWQVVQLAKENTYVK